MKHRAFIWLRARGGSAHCTLHPCSWKAVGLIVTVPRWNAAASSPTDCCCSAPIKCQHAGSADTPESRSPTRTARFGASPGFSSSMRAPFQQHQESIRCSRRWRWQVGLLNECSEHAVRSNSLLLSCPARLSKPTRRPDRCIHLLQAVSVARRRPLLLFVFSQARQRTPRAVP